MKKSIRTKLFYGISALIILFVILSWFLNFNFLDKYYIAMKGAGLRKEYRFIEGIYGGDPGAVHDQLEKLVSTTGAHIVIFDHNFQIKYDSFPRPPRKSQRERPEFHRLPPYISRTSDWSKPAYHVDAPKKPRPNIKFLNFTAKLRNGDYLWLGTPLAEIHESVAISNRFFLITGILTILLGGIFIMLYSKRFTQPILELSDIAENMAKLDFTKMYPVKTQDEIGELGRSINSLSEQLGRSITELQEANLRLEEDNERQKRIDEMRKEFISNVSHELKTPIALIQGYAEGLRLNIAGDQEDKDFYCDVITDEAEKMHKLVKDLLDLSAIDSGCMPLDKERFDLAELTAQVLGKYHLIMKDKGIKVYIEKDGEAWVHADIWRIEQVIVNLIDNAIAHIEGERILNINITVEERRVRFAVFNSGAAIPEDSLDKVWLSFYKIDKARTRTRGGSGLGLSIVRAILEQHQGCYGVRNRMSGVEFWFELKLSQEVNKS